MPDVSCLSFKSHDQEVKWRSRDERVLGERENRERDSMESARETAGRESREEQGGARRGQRAGRGFVCVCVCRIL